MNGGVWEWCMDWYSPDYYEKSTTQNPINKNIGDKKTKVTRGGGWDSDAATCTISYRKHYIPRSYFNDRGFRVVILN